MWVSMRTGEIKETFAEVIKEIIAEAKGGYINIIWKKY